MVKILIIIFDLSVSWVQGSFCGLSFPGLLKASFCAFRDMHTDLIQRNECVCVCVCVCVCEFGFNVAFNNFSVISRRCLVVTGSSMLTFIVLPH